MNSLTHELLESPQMPLQAPIDITVRLASPEEEQAFDPIKAKAATIQNGVKKKILVVINVGETPLGPVGKVSGINAYDMRHGVMCDENCTIVVDKKYYEGAVLSNDHLEKIGVHASGEKPNIYPIDMDGRMHFESLVHGLQSDSDNEVKHLPWKEIGAIHAFHWGPHADKLVKVLHQGQWISADTELPSERADAVRDLNNKVEMMRAFQNRGIQVAPHRFGNSPEELIEGYTSLSQQTETHQLYLKLGQAVSGIGNYPVHSLQELQAIIDDLPEGYLEEHGALLEEQFEILFSPGAVFYLGKDGTVYQRSISDQITKGSEHLGNRSPSLLESPDYQRFAPDVREGILAYAQEAVDRGVTDLSLCLDFLVVKNHKGDVHCYPSDPNGRESGSSHQRTALRKIFRKFDIDPHEYCVSMTTDNNVYVSPGIEPAQIEELCVERCWDALDNFHRNCLVVPFNVTPAYHATHPDNAKVQVGMVQLLPKDFPVQEASRVAAAFRKEVHSVFKQAL